MSQKTKKTPTAAAPLVAKAKAEKAPTDCPTDVKQTKAKPSAPKAVAPVASVEKNSQKGEKKPRKVKEALVAELPVPIDTPVTIDHNLIKGTRRRDVVLSVGQKAVFGAIERSLNDTCHNLSVLTQLTTLHRYSAGGHTKKHLTEKIGDARKALKASQTQLVDFLKCERKLMREVCKHSGPIKGFPDLGDFPSSSGKRNSKSLDQPVFIPDSVAEFIKKANVSYLTPEAREALDEIVDNRIITFRIWRVYHTLYAMSNNILLPKGSKGGMIPSSYMRITDEYRATFGPIFKIIEDEAEKGLIKTPVDFEKAIAYCHISPILKHARIQNEDLSDEQKELMDDDAILEMLANAAELINKSKPAKVKKAPKVPKAKGKADDAPVAAVKPETKAKPAPKKKATA